MTNSNDRMDWVDELTEGELDDLVADHLDWCEDCESTRDCLRHEDDIMNEGN